MQIQTRSSNPVCTQSWIVLLSTKRWADWDDWPAGGIVVLRVEARRRLQLAAHKGRAAVIVLTSASRRPRRVTVLPAACGQTEDTVMSEWKWWTARYGEQGCAASTLWPWSLECFRRGLSRSLLCDAMEPASVSLSRLSRPLAVFPLWGESHGGEAVNVNE